MASNSSHQESFQLDNMENVELQDLADDGVDDSQSQEVISPAETRSSCADGVDSTESPENSESTIPGTPDSPSVSTTTSPVERNVRIDNSSPPPEYASLEPRNRPRRLNALARRVRPEADGPSPPPSYEGLVVDYNVTSHPLEEETSFAHRPPPMYNEVVREDAGGETTNRESVEASQAREPVHDGNEPQNVSRGATEDATNNAEDVEAAGKFESVLQCVNRLKCADHPKCITCRTNMVERCTKIPIWLKIVLVMLLVFVTCVILFPIQFSYVQYHQFALAKRKSTGVVEMGRVYESGCYALGADRKFVYLPRDLQKVSFLNTGMFTANNVEVSIDLNVFYRIRYDGVASLYQRYADGYGTVVEKTILSQLRNYAPRIHSDFYTNNRSEVEVMLHQAVKDKFDGFGIDVPFMDIIQFDLPPEVKELKLAKLLLSVDIEKELAERKASLINLETDRQLVAINMEAAEVKNNATYQAAAISILAKTDKQNYLDETHSKAYANMTDKLNVTLEKQAMSFFYLATLRTMANYHGSVGFDTLMNYVQSGTWSN